MGLKGGNAQCNHCEPKDAYSITDENGKGICIGRLRSPKLHRLDRYSVCFIKSSKITRFGVSRSELQMMCAAGSFLLLLEEIGKWNK